MNTVSTRLASMGDLDQLAVMFDAYRQFYELPADLALSRQYLHDRMLRNESTLLIAEDGEGAAVGFCQMYPSFCSLAAAPIHALYDLFVDPRARKLGAGRALLLAAEAHALDTGAVRLDLTTAKTNLPAQSLYGALGWQRDDIFYAYSKNIAA